MKHCQSMQKLVASLVAVAFFFLGVVAAPAQAALVGTQDLLIAKENDSARQKVMLFLERRDVAKHLHALGVDTEEAKARVDAMTTEEIHLLARKIDQMPAGGDAIGVIAVAVFLTVLVLVITDIVGITDIFTFIKKR